MLESAEIGHKTSKATYAREEPKLRDALLNAQYDLSRSGHGPVLIVMSGVESGGRGETANKLTEWMDPRFIRVIAFGPRTQEELARPPMWRYWRVLPPRGKLGIFMNAWYNELLIGHAQGEVSRERLDAYMQQIVRTEQMLSDEGTVLLKFWIHLSKQAQKARLDALDSDPRTKWQVTKNDWRAFRLYSKSHQLWEHVLRETSTGVAPWYVVEGADERYRNLTVGKILLNAITSAISATATTPKRAVTPPAPSVVDNVKLIRDLDLTKKLSAKEYKYDLGKYQGRLAKLSRHKRFADHSLILAFEGVDAAGKGGAIRRVTGALDARQYVTVPIAAPTEEERAHPYLWRFWRNVPARGDIAIFDRLVRGLSSVEELSAPNV
jgi:polyphosphate kinase 2 (PPK2 family)